VRDRVLRRPARLPNQQRHSGQRICRARRRRTVSPRRKIYWDTLRRRRRPRPNCQTAWARWLGRPHVANRQICSRRSKTICCTRTRHKTNAQPQPGAQSHALLGDTRAWERARVIELNRSGDRELRTSPPGQLRLPRWSSCFHERSPWRARIPECRAPARVARRETHSGRPSQWPVTMHLHDWVLLAP